MGGQRGEFYLAEGFRARMTGGLPKKLLWVRNFKGKKVSRKRNKSTFAEKVGSQNSAVVPRFRYGAGRGSRTTKKKKGEERREAGPDSEKNSASRSQSTTDSERRLGGRGGFLRKRKGAEVAGEP